MLGEKLEECMLQFLIEVLSCRRLLECSTVPQFGYTIPLAHYSNTNQLEQGYSQVANVAVAQTIMNLGATER
jgi:hypothetical protein